MTIENPTELDHNSIALIGQEDACDLDAANGTEKKLCPACPTGKIFIPDHVVMDEFSAACGTAVVTFGIAGGNCDEFLGDQTLTNIGAGYAAEVLILRPIPNATPAASCKLTAGEEFAMEITTKEGSALTARIDVFGHYKNA